MGKIKCKNFKPIPYRTIEKAVHGNSDAIHDVLKYYERYIRKIATGKMYDKNGVPYIGVDETLVERMESKLAAKIMLFKL